MRTWTIVACALTALAVVIGLVAYTWVMMGDVAISWRGLLAMGLGTLLAIGLGVGLMTLVFFSARRGYDDEAGH
jgi:hypothetical protein